VASTLGKLVEVDWQSLFGSFFAMTRIKVKCRNPGKITRKSIMEMDDDIYLLNFKARDVEQEADNEARF